MENKINLKDDQYIVFFDLEHVNFFIKTVKGSEEYWIPATGMYTGMECKSDISVIYNLMNKQLDLEMQGKPLVIHLMEDENIYEIISYIPTDGKILVFDPNDVKKIDLIDVKGLSLADVSKFICPLGLLDLERESNTKEVMFEKMLYLGEINYNNKIAELQFFIDIALDEKNKEDFIKYSNKLQEFKKRF